MKMAIITGLVATTVATAGLAQANSVVKKGGIRVVAGAKTLTPMEKASANGLCDCDLPTKPGYGFGAKVEHYGPPGQGFNPGWTWRRQAQDSDYTPNGHPMPPRALN